MERESVPSRNPQIAASATGRVVYDALVLDARFRQSLVTVRSLGSRGLCVAALEAVDGLPAPAFSLRWCRYKDVCPALEETMDYLTHLEQTLDSTGARVLITSSDGTIALIHHHRERLERRVRIALVLRSSLVIKYREEKKPKGGAERCPNR